MLDLSEFDPLSPNSTAGQTSTDAGAENASHADKTRSNLSSSSPSLQQSSSKAQLLRKRAEQLEKELSLKKQQVAFQQELIKLDCEQAELSRKLAQAHREAIEVELVEKFGSGVLSDSSTCRSQDQEVSWASILSKQTDGPGGQSSTSDTSTSAVADQGKSTGNSTSVNPATQEVSCGNPLPGNVGGPNPRSQYPGGSYAGHQLTVPGGSSLPPAPPGFPAEGTTSPKSVISKSTTGAQHAAHNKVPQPQVGDWSEAFKVLAEGMKQAPLPPRDVRKFTGDPLDYYRFITDFNDNIASRVKDPMTNLTYLISHCTGKAYDAVQSTIILRPPERALITAKRILEEQFGQEYKVVAAHMKLIKEGPRLREGDAESMYKLATQMRNCYITLTEWNYDANLNNHDTIDKVFLRLPHSLQREFQRKSASMYATGREPDFKSLLDFVQHNAMLLNTRFGRMLHTGTRKPESDNPAFKKRTVTTTQVNQSSSSMSAKCFECDQSHPLWKCPTFLKRTVKERLSLVSEARLCFNCLKSKTHIARNCPSLGRCKTEGCGRLHHSLLHYSDRSCLPAADERANSGSFGGGKTVSSTLQSSRKARLKVVPVEVSLPLSTSKVLRTYAFLDDGSNATLCTNRLMRKLGVQGEKERMQISTIFGERTQSIFKLDLKVKGINEAREFKLTEVYALPSLPDVSADIVKEDELRTWPHLDEIEITELDSPQIDLLIGADHIQCLLVSETKVGEEGQPLGIHTGLGWALAGSVGSASEERASVYFTSLGHTLIHDQLERMFTMDFCAENDLQLAPSIEDTQALTIMESSVQKRDGHYEVALPWKQCKRPSLPNNRKLAERRLDCLKGKLERDSELFNNYKTKVNEYIDLGYAEQVTESLQSPHTGEVWYIPHHATTQNKFRIVFDCAARYNNTSLNDNLLKGPDHTNNLVGVLARFRQERYAYTCDIKGMFHQIFVSPVDTDYLRFLWWPNNDLSSTPVDYKMTVHPFGATSSPSVAGYVLRKVATDNAVSADETVVKTVQNNFYVDDCLKSVNNLNAAIIQIHQLRALLATGGFYLTKFTSNCREILFSIPESDRSVSNDFNIMCNKLPIGTLGLIWDPDADQIKVKVDVKEKPCTRRGLLSVISQVYDPIGFVQPFILPMKKHLQILNAEGLSWDQPLPQELQVDWNCWIAALPALQHVTIPRCYKPADFEPVRAELHCFSDGSQIGYGAVAYLRMVSSTGDIHCSFLLGKSRVAPMKTMTIPRLELAAAVVAVKLSHFLRHELEYNLDRVTYWTDSTTVLHYIANTTTRYQTFVANRLKVIHDLSAVDEWRYVDTRSNPADLASRGAYPDKHTEHPSWFRGPEYLWQSELFWPAHPLPNPPWDDHEVKKVHAMCHSRPTKPTAQPSPLEDLCMHYSSWHALQKAVAWILKCKEFLKHKYILKTTLPPLSATSGLTVKDIEAATEEIVKHVQAQAFPAAIEELKTQGHVTVTRSKLRRTPSLQSLQRLNPFLKDGVLRVGGRIQRSALPYHVKHPVILPSNHPVTELLIKHYHEQEGHSGTIHTLANIRQFYWILRGQSSVRAVLRQCMKCRLQRAKPAEQIMGPLPACRLTPGHAPFHYTGVDYMGPIYVKSGRSTPKRYICVFTCLSIRAVHLEIAHSLDTSSFLQALSRFIGRRSKPSEIWSDNGTNFIGADRELREAVQGLESSNVHSAMLKYNIDWHFNPPAASHQGGVWERVIRTVRKVLYALTQDRVMNDEALHSFIVEVEQILNSRPITPLSSDPADDLPLTPKMLLTGRLHSELPLGQFIKADGYRKSWKLIQLLADQFWSQWLKLYIPCLQKQQKWFKPCRNFAVGDIVLIVDDRCRRGSWPKGIVKEVFSDKEGRVRRVRVETSSSSLTRDIRNLSLLEGSC